MKHLGIDYGTKRIGLAVSDETGTLAFPLTTIHAGEHALSELQQILKKEEVEAIVIGESRNFSGDANPVMENIEQFKSDIEELSGLPVAYEAELFSSALAARQFAPDGSRKQNPSHAKVDASAAAIILQSYLDKRKKVE